MLTVEFDEPASVAVWLFTGTTNQEKDYEDYVASLAQLSAAARRAGVGTGLMWVARGNPPPNATWRRRIAEVSASYPRNCVFALVSDSPVIRAIATAIDWIRPSPYEVTAVASFDEAFAWLEKRRDPRTMSLLRRTLVSAQATAQR